MSAFPRIKFSFCRPAIKNDSSAILRLFEIARVFVRLDHVAQHHRKPGSQHGVTGCETLRSQPRC